MNAKNFPFLPLWGNGVFHHCVLLPNIYSIENCKLLLEFISFWKKKPIASLLCDPDIFLYTKFNNELSPLKVESSRQIIINAQNSPLNENKVFIIEDIDLASNSAVNAILKIIEEPPKNTYFFLTYQSFENVLQTIRSRSLKYKNCHILKENFEELCEFFEISANYELFENAGYNFVNYKKLLDIPQSIENIKEIISSKDFSQQDVWFFIESEIQRKARKCKNFSQMVVISNFYKKVAFLQKAIYNLNINKQNVFFQLIEELCAIIV